VSEQWDSISNFLMYLGVTLPILAIGIGIFMLVTPYKEYAIIREGASAKDPQKMAAAKAVAHDLGGKMIGLAIVMASAVYNAVGLADLLVWGIIGIVFQVIIFYLFELITPFKVVEEIPKGNVAVAIFTSRLSIATGLLMAALISY
jgi:putative membrane protein